MPQRNQIEFPAAFTALTGMPPFPWQERLYDRFLSDEPDSIPSVCNLPTGLGKTSVVAIWLLALAQRPERIPRRLVYVVNRRTVLPSQVKSGQCMSKSFGVSSRFSNELPVSVCTF